MTGTPEPTPRDLQSEIEAALKGVSLQNLEAATAAPTSPSAPGSSPGSSPGSAPGGNLLRGTVVGVSGDDVIVELGPRSQGVAPVRDFESPPSVGERFEFVRVGEEDGLVLLSRGAAQRVVAWNEMKPGSWVKARVTGQNTGGLELRVGEMPAFMPASQVDRKRVEDFSRYIGQSLVSEVLEVDRERKRIVLSRRAVLERENEERRQKVAQELVPGSVVSGKVSRMESYGAFVDIGGGVEGLVHVSNLSVRRVEKPEDVVKLGQTVEAQVLEVSEGGKRIRLGMKQLEPDPWEGIHARLGADQVVSGTVVRTCDFGAFIEVEPGVEGLLHVSEMDSSRARRPQDVCKPGETLAVRVITVDERAKRMSLSRLDPRGTVLGSEDAVEESELADVLREGRDAPHGTNLGNLFKQALEKNQ